MRMFVSNCSVAVGVWRVRRKECSFGVMLVTLCCGRIMPLCCVTSCSSFLQ